ncbi:hypothetical protein ScPMuIL_002372 [Solemya velum]
MAVEPHVSVEAHFAQRLAANEKKIRDKAIKKLRRWLELRSAKNKDVFSESDFLKIWKGLHYCLWMQDKPLIQEELAENVSRLVHVFGTVDVSMLFFKVFLLTEAREWNGIDRWRLDKFMMLVRQMVRQSLILLKSHSWKGLLVTKFKSVLMETVLSTSESNTPDGLTIHLADLYLTELSSVGQDQLTEEQVWQLLEPFFLYIAKAKNMTIVQRVVSRIFDPIFNETLSSKLRDKGRANNGEESDEDENTVVNEDGDGEQEMEEPTLKLKFDCGLLADRLFKIGSAKECAGRNRALIYSLVKKFRDLSEGMLPKGDLDDHTEDITQADVASAVHRMQRFESGSIRKKGKKRKLEKNADDVDKNVENIKENGADCSPLRESEADNLTETSQNVDKKQRKKEKNKMHEKVDKKRRKSESADKNKMSGILDENQAKSEANDINISLDNVDKKRRKSRVDRNETLETVKRKRKKSEAMDDAIFQNVNTKQETTVEENTFENGSTSKASEHTIRTGTFEIVNKKQKKTAVQNTTFENENRKQKKSDDSDKVNKKRRKSEPGLDTLELLHKGKWKMSSKSFSHPANIEEYGQGETCAVVTLDHSKTKKKNKMSSQSFSHPPNVEEYALDHSKTKKKKKMSSQSFSHPPNVEEHGQGEPCVVTLDHSKTKKKKKVTSQSFSHPPNMEEFGQGEPCTVVTLNHSKTKKKKKMSSIEIKEQKQGVSTSPKTKPEKEVSFITRATPSASAFHVVENDEVEIWVPNKKYKGKLKQNEAKEKFSSSFAAFEKNPTTPTALVRKSVSSMKTPKTDPKKIKKVNIAEVPASVPANAKHVSFNMKKNRALDFQDSIKVSPGSPFNPNQKPNQGILRSSPLASSTPYRKKSNKKQSYGKSMNRSTAADFF